MEVPLQRGTGFAFITASLYGPQGIYEAKLLFDTGAAITTLSSRLSKALGYELASLPREDTPVVGGGASSRRMVLEKIILHDSTRDNVPARFMELPLDIDGLRGNDLLRTFNLLAVLDVKANSAKFIFRS